MARRRAEPSILLGPILYFRGEQRDRWWLSALFVLDGDVEPDDLRVDGVTLPVPPRHLTVWRRCHVWRFDFAIPRGMRDTDVAYGFPDGPNWNVVVPGRQSLPRMAILYGSGMTGAAKAAGQPEAAALSAALPAPLWPDLLARHSADRYHLLVQAGGQIDGDAVLAAAPQAASLLGDASRRLGPPLPVVAEELMSAGFDRMLRGWSGAAAAAVLASIPSVMMWDGSDLGRQLAGAWAGREDGDAASRSLRPLMVATRRQVQLFQTGSVTDSPPDCLWGAACGTLAQGFVMGEAGLLALDLWTDRSARRILSERDWSLLPDWLDRFTGCRHLILVSGAPLLAPGAAAALDRLGAALPAPLRRRLTHGLGDRWTTPGRQAEWERMLRTLGDFSRRTGCRVTIASRALSGGAGRGVLRGGGLEMWQLYAPRFAASPLAAVRPGWRVRLAEPLAARPDHPLPAHRFEMPPFPEGGRRMLHGPGWIACSFDGKGQLHARWCLPADAGRYAQAI